MKVESAAARFSSRHRTARCLLRSGIALCLWVMASSAVFSQVESVGSGPPNFLWISHGRVEGHLALNYSPAGAFSPDSSMLAIANGDKVVLMELGSAGVRKVLRPHLPNLEDLDIQSCNFLKMNQVLLFATGIIHVKGKPPGGPTPLLAFQWDVELDRLAGKVDAVGAKGGFGPPRFFPQIGYLGLNQENNFDLWNPRDGRGGRITIPQLTRQPALYEFSPDGHWLLIAQIPASGTADPVVVELKEHRFVDSLPGHKATVLGMNFSRDDTKVVTACEDGNVRIYSVPGWKLLNTLVGHQGPVHEAEFSPDGHWVVSAGEDKTVRVWSADDGKLLQTLEESREPLLSVAFSPNGEYIAAGSEKTVLVWQRTAK